MIQKSKGRNKTNKTTKKKQTKSCNPEIKITNCSGKATLREEVNTNVFLLPGHIILTILNT